MNAGRSPLVDSLLAGEYPAAQPWERHAAIEWIAGELRRGAGITADQVRRLARTLNEEREFASTTILCEGWQSRAQPDDTITRIHAQSLIEQGGLDAATSLLTGSLERMRKAGRASHEEAEHLGLLGRAAKEQFLATRDSAWLSRAVGQYYDAYKERPSDRCWHGINAVALIARANREMVPLEEDGSYERLAEDILTTVTARWQANSSDPWLAATASEALLALGRCELAELFLYRFLQHPRITPFGVASYSRQLREIWQGADDLGCAGRLYSIIARHELRAYGTWRADARSLPQLHAAIEANPGAYEKNFLGDSTFNVAALTRMLTSCKAIGCVHDGSGVRVGTGFLLEGAHLADRFAGKAVFVTNAHVIGDAGVPIETATVTFELLPAPGGQPQHYRVSELLFSSPMGQFGICCPEPESLDTALVSLRDFPDDSTCLQSTATLPQLTAQSRAFVVGHPKGAGLQVSLHDSQLLDFDDTHRLMHYRTPTEPGSSGSPVFNESWEVVAVHHGGSRRMPRLHGSGTYEANEGIAIKAIRRRLAAV